MTYPIFSTKQEAIEFVNKIAKTPIGQRIYDYHVVELNSEYAITTGMDTRTVYTAKGIRV